MSITREQARAALEAQRLAIHTLTGYARYIDIPGVPDDSNPDDRQYEVVETPLAAHHILTLNVLQLMVQGLLVYRPQVLDSPIDFSLLRGEKPPRGGRVDGGGAIGQVHAPSPKSKNPQTSRTAFAQQSSDTTPAKIATDVYETCTSALYAVLNARINPEDALSLIYGTGEKFDVCRRVLIMEPPGSAKSTYASVVFPTWVMGKVKAFETILTGWGDPICRRHGKRARQICASPQFRALFQTGLDPNTRSAEDWALTNNSSYKSSGIQSGVAGFRTHGLIWDDLTKNRKEADSQTIRDDVHNAYIDDARSRKTPTAWEVGIGTRWHEDEIMGRILPEGYAGESGFMRCRDGNIWYVICMAAECERDDDPLGREPGEMLWPEWFDEGYWAEKRMNPRSWGSLYQQRPAPEEGIVFKKEWMKWYETAPKDLSKYISFDPGVSDHGDETSILVWGVDEENRVYLLDEWYRKCTMDVWIEQLITLVKIHNPIKVISESGVIRRASEPFLARAMRNTGCFFACEWVTRSSNKEAMAAPAIGLCAQGMVYLPKNSVGENLLRDLLAFPASKQDHRPDAFANFGLHLQSIFAAQPVKAVKKQVSVLESGEIPIKALMPPRYSKKRSRWTLN